MFYIIYLLLFIYLGKAETRARSSKVAKRVNCDVNRIIMATWCRCYIKKYVSSGIKWDQVGSEWFKTVFVEWSFIQVVGCVTDGLNNKLLVHYSGHRLHDWRLEYNHAQILVNIRKRLQIIANHALFELRLQTLRDKGKK